MPALAVQIDCARRPTNHHSHKRGSTISAHGTAKDGSGNASDETSANVTSQGTASRIGFSLRGPDLGDVLSSALLDDLRETSDLPIGHKHAVWPEAHVFLQVKPAASLRSKKIFRVG